MKSNDASTSLRLLREGNERFTSGLRSIESLTSASRLGELADKGQRPFAIILCCSDSRLPAELVFDQGFGDLFVIRVAGNVVAPSLIASMEFAATQFGTPLILVLGHTQCGAVKAARDFVEGARMDLTDNLRELIGRIEPVARTSRDLLDCVHKNVKHSMDSILEESQVIRGLVESGRLEIHGALFDLKTGAVRFDG
jgi:carbonic anhydrase